MDQQQPSITLVQETWASLLGVDNVAPDDDFFELGGHSLQAAATVAALSARLGFDLPPLALFEAPTPAEMAELIEEVRTGRHHTMTGGSVRPLPPWMVPLQRDGGGRPVFVFPAGHDEIAALAIEARVAAHVGREHPFWGFRRNGESLADAREAGVQPLAAAYVRQIRAVQRTGPYLLYANCAGGVYAWEAARQLIAAGERIAGLLFYEIPLNPQLVAPLESGISPPVEGTAVPPDEYLPAPLPVDLTLLMTGFWQERGWSEGWRHVALGSVETVVISGETVTAFERREERIARHVRDWIARAESRITAA
ncbi:MAG: phosphopantetheine-binding protein [Thermomicrobiales bacterium]